MGKTKTNSILGTGKQVGWNSSSQSDKASSNLLFPKKNISKNNDRIDLREKARESTNENQNSSPPPQILDVSAFVGAYGQFRDEVQKEFAPKHYYWGEILSLFFLLFFFFFFF